MRCSYCDVEIKHEEAYRFMMPFPTYQQSNFCRPSCLIHWLKGEEPPANKKAQSSPAFFLLILTLLLIMYLLLLPPAARLALLG